MDRISVFLSMTDQILQDLCNDQVFLEFPGPPQFKDRSRLNEWIARPAQAYVDFQCDVCGSPEPNVTWYFKDRRITLGVSGPAKVGHTPVIGSTSRNLLEIQ